MLHINCLLHFMLAVECKAFSGLSAARLDSGLVVFAPRLYRSCSTWPASDTELNTHDMQLHKYR